MRIRKRPPPPPPPPPSSAPPLPLTPDLPSSRLQPLPSLVAASFDSRGLHHHDDLSAQNIKSLHLPCDSPNQPLRRPKVEEDRHRPDLQLYMLRRTNGWICSNGEKEDEKKKRDCMHRRPSQDSLVGVGEGEESIAEDKGLSPTNRRNGNNPGAETSVGNSSSSSLSHQVGGRWWEGETAFPLKKRRGSIERKVMEKQKKMKIGMTTKRNNKWINEEDEEEEKEGGVDNTNVKKRGGGGSVMEGSRCSRVNGRGWRCCQQTLVGYSLCEHHLGKGRLRSISSVRSRTSAITRTKKEEAGLLLSSSKLQHKGIELEVEDEEEDDDDDDDDEDEDDDDDNEKPLMITKKRKKIGMVKARSISSLLGAPQVPQQPSSDNNYNLNNIVKI